MDDFVVEFQIIIEAICSSGCTNADDVGETLYNQVTDGLRDAINDGSLVTALRDVSSDLSDLLESANAIGDFCPVVIPILSLLPDVNAWYPDWRGQSQTCKNDGEYP